MIATHLSLLVLFSAVVSATFAILLREDVSSRIRYGLLTFATFVLTALAIGWIMSPFPS